MTGKTGWKYSIGFDQSMSNGMIKFSGNYYFDDPQELKEHKFMLSNMLSIQEDVFKHAGYRVASEIPNNMEKFATKNAQSKLGGIGDIKDGTQNVNVTEKISRTPKSQGGKTK